MFFKVKLFFHFFLQILCNFFRGGAELYCHFPVTRMGYLLARQISLEIDRLILSVFLFCFSVLGYRSFF